MRTKIARDALEALGVEVCRLCRARTAALLGLDPGHGQPRPQRRADCQRRRRGMLTAPARARGAGGCGRRHRLALRPGRGPTACCRCRRRLRSTARPSAPHQQPHDEDGRHRQQRRRRQRQCRDQDSVATMALHDSREARPRHELHDLSEQGLANVRARCSGVSSPGSYSVSRHVLRIGTKSNPPASLANARSRAPRGSFSRTVVMQIIPAGPADVDADRRHDGSCGYAERRDRGDREHRGAAARASLIGHRRRRRSWASRPDAPLADANVSFGGGGA